MSVVRFPLKSLLKAVISRDKPVTVKPPQWFVLKKQRRIGPFTSEKLRRLAQTNKLLPTDMVSQAGGSWVAAAEVRDLFPSVDKKKAATDTAATATISTTRPIDTATSTDDTPATPSKTNETTSSGAAYPMAIPVLDSEFESNGSNDPLGGHSLNDELGFFDRMSVLAGSQVRVVVVGIAILLVIVAAITTLINRGELEDRNLVGERSGNSISPQAAPLAVTTSTATPSGSPTSALTAAGPTANVSTTSTNTPSPRSPLPAPLQPVTLAALGPAVPNVVDQAPEALPPVAWATRLADARPSMVELRTQYVDRNSSVSSGFVFGDDGGIITTLGTFRSAQSITALFNDGTVADVTGFAAVLPERDLVLLKTEQKFPAIVAAAREAVVGDTVHLAGGSQPPRSFISTRAAVEKSRLLDIAMDTPGGNIYLDRGTKVMLLSEKAPDNYRGGAALDTQGEALGILSFGPTGEQFLIDRRHLAELIQQAKPLRPLGELSQFYKPEPTSFAGRRRVVVVGVRGPGGVVLRPVAVAPAPFAAPAAIPNWIDQLRASYKRRGDLVAERDAGRRSIALLTTEAARLNSEFRGLDNQAAPLRLRYRAITQEIAELRALPSNADGDSLVEIRINNLESDLRPLETAYNQLDAQARPLRMRFNEINAEIALKNVRLAAIAVDAKILRDEFLKLLDPFGSSSAAHADAAVEFFTGKIQAEADPAFAIFARGCAHLTSNKTDLALNDLDQAVKKSPNESTFLAVRGVAQARLNKDAEARKDLQDAVRLDDKNCWSRVHYALVLFRTGAFSVAEQQLRDCMKIAPTDPEAFVLLAMLKATGDAKLRNGAYAVKTAQAAYDASSAKDWKCFLALAMAHAEVGDFTKAFPFAAKASAAATSVSQIEWCRECLATIQMKKPIRIDWKTFDLRAKL